MCSKQWETRRDWGMFCWQWNFLESGFMEVSYSDQVEMAVVRKVESTTSGDVTCVLNGASAIWLM